jgi:hypothetical protein
MTLIGYAAFCAGLLIAAAICALVFAIIAQGPPEDE